MEARMKNPVLVLPKALEAAQMIGAVLKASSIPQATFLLVYMRASQINGCSVCIDMHAKELRKEGESEERVFNVAGWRENRLYSPSERAALALAECGTRLADQSDPVPDAVWSEATRHFDTTQLAELVLAIGAINLFNRINAITRQIPGEF